MKPEFAKYLQQDSILVLEGDSKEVRNAKGAKSSKINVLEAIIQHAATRCPLDEELIRDLVWKREHMMTTGVGKGLALPHIRVNGFASPLVVVAVCKKPIPAEDYKSLDGQPIRLVVFLAADESDQEAYLKLLGSISAKLKSDNVIDDIMAAGNDCAKILDILSC